MKKWGVVVCVLLGALDLSSGYAQVQTSTRTSPSYRNAAALFTSSAAVQRPSAEGSWRIIFHLEPNHSRGATQCVEFTTTGEVVGEPLSGTWVSTTFAGWRGQWIQEGDHVRWYGFTSGGLATSEFGHLPSNNAMSGEFTHFLPPDGVTSTAGGWRARRVQDCPDPAESKNPALSIQNSSDDPAVDPKGAKSN